MMNELIEEMIIYWPYRGKHLAVVEDINDPDKLRRIRVKCPVVSLKENLLWALPCDGFKTNWLPKKSDIVWIEFEGWNPAKPIWTGLAVAKEDVDASFLDNYNETYRKDVDYNGNSIEWMKDGFVINDVNGNIITTSNKGIKFQDKNNNIIEMKDGKITFNDVFEVNS